MNDAPPLLPVVPPPLPASEQKLSPDRRIFAQALSIFIALFLFDAVLCLADDSLILAWKNYSFTALRGVVAPLTLLATVVIYPLLGIIPFIPKRLFLPLTIFHPLAGLAALLFLIYSFERMQEVVWVVSLCQLILSLGILYWVPGGFKFQWPILAASRLKGPAFTWRNLFAFVLVNVFVLAPALGVYLLFCVNRAVDHYSDGFLALRPTGLTVQVRKYIRSDGKTIELVPMSHIGETEFYRELSKSFSSNAIILMEGVTDRKSLLTNRISYQRVATTLGVAEQQKEFKLAPGRTIPADVDVEEFTRSTIDFMNHVMLVYSKGWNAEAFVKLLDYSEPDIEERFFADILLKRNRRVVDEIKTQLAQTENIIVPWGAAHMPGIAKEIRQLGFSVSESQEYVAIRFGFGRGKSTGQRK